jgi:hypothetical protein
MDMRRTIAVLTLALAVLSAACADKPRKVVIRPPAPETVYVKKPVPAPRAAPLPVSPTQLAFDAIGDTARLIVPAGAQCAAAMESVASIDSTGLVTSVANGDTHLRCWQDGQNAIIKVRVQQQVSHVAIVADRALEMGHAGDSLHLALNQTDRRSTPVVASPPAWLSLTPSVVTVDPSGTALAVADSGSARIVGQVEGFADTIIVQVGAKGSASKLLGRATNTSSRARTLANAARVAQRTAAAPGEVAGQAFPTGGPTAQSQVQGQAIINARAPRIADSLFQDPSALANLQRLLIPIALGALAERQNMDPLNGLTHHSGTLFGGGLEIMTRGPLSFRMKFETGTLSGDTTTSGTDKTLTVSEGSFDACLALSPWLTVLGGAQARAYQGTSSLERWTTIRAGGEASFNLGGGPLYGFARAVVMPLISVQNDVSSITAPTFGIGAGLGVGVESPRLSARLMYDIEHYSFPTTSGRKEQFAQLAFRLGYKFGW